jgi:hypothetical protein
MTRYVHLALLCFVLGCGAMACAPMRVEPTAERVIRFAAYGDMPYRIEMPDGRSDAQVLEEDIAPEIRRREDLPFVIHLGDLGRPEDVCADAKLEEVQAFWATALVKPVFYTPGDNEWTDCDRPRRPELPAPTSELERLVAIRRIFFGRAKDLDPSWQYETQSAQPENALWWYEGVLFVTVHMVSTDNGREEILLDDPVQAIALVTERDEANRRWLEHAFTLAMNREAAAVVIATQLDPLGPPEGGLDAFTRGQNRPAYAAFCEQILVLSAALGKPVLLVHGDTNAYCLDQPFPRNRAPKLGRLNAPGDYTVIDAAVVSINPSRPNRPFEASGLLSGQAAPQECGYSPT